MPNSLLSGSRIRLTAVNPATDAATFARWDLNSEFGRLLDTDPPWPSNVKARQARMEEQGLAESHRHYFFGIRLLAEETLLGFVGLWMIDWKNREAFVGIAIGEPAYWGHGYGTEAMQLVLQFAFQEIDLHRVALQAFAYNARAIRSYEKCGFRHEGRDRQSIQRDGQRWDVVSMGILRREWEGQKPVKREQ